MLSEHTSVDLNAPGFGQRNESEQFGCQVAVSGRRALDRILAEFGNDCDGSCVRLRCYASGMTEEPSLLLGNERQTWVAVASAQRGLWQ